MFEFERLNTQEESALQTAITVAAVILANAIAIAVVLITIRIHLRARSVAASSALQEGGVAFGPPYGCVARSYRGEKT